jgi:peptidoglycan pentaglycine glycine transferase (the first glycine)
MPDAQTWNESVDHPLQSWEWGEFRKNRQPISRINGMLVVWTRVPNTPWHFGYIPMGKWPNNEDLKALFLAGKDVNAIGIRMEPNLMKNEKVTVYKELKPGRPLFKQKTFIIDLTQSEDELLGKMHPKARYNIRVAQRHGVTIREDNSPEAFEKYLELTFSGTAKRQKIYSHGRDYHRLLWDCLKKNMAHLFVAVYGKEIITADIIFKFRDRIYYAYGASKLEFKEVMAPTLLLWEIAKWGKSTGVSKFDLWGAEEGRGFSRFKEQFGGEIVELAGTFDLPINKLLYRGFRIAEEARWKVLRLLR